MIHSRMGDTPPLYEVTSAITSATAMDGSALDQWPGLPNGPGQQTTAAAAAAATAGAASGGSGSGGIWPLAGGLPLHLPSLGLPTLPATLVWVAIAAGGIFLYSEARR
jgi:hypothetical protein